VPARSAKLYKIMQNASPYHLPWNVSRGVVW
jgi:hypothetical protein